MTKVMCFGTFDLLHLGHLNYFQQAKKLGDYLIVVVARDKTKKLQKKKTFFSEKERLKLIKSLNLVDQALLGGTKDYYKVIQNQKPDILALGYDHQIREKALKNKLKKLNLNPKIKKMKPYQPRKHKSSKIKIILLNQK